MSYTQANLLNDVLAYRGHDAAEEKDRLVVADFLRNDMNPFDRKNFTAHITGSAWVLSPDLQSALLTHHMILDKWLQCGGHADGEADILNVALREAQEESGIEAITPLSRAIFDIDVHPIPANLKRNEPDHFHYDIRYLFRAEHTDFAVSAESKDLQWVPIARVFDLGLQDSIIRMANKWKNALENNALSA